MRNKNFSVVTSRSVEVKEIGINGDFGNVQLLLDNALVGDEGMSYRGEVRITMKKDKFLKAVLQYMISDIEGYTVEEKKE